MVGADGHVNVEVIGDDPELYGFYIAFGKQRARVALSALLENPNGPQNSSRKYILQATTTDSEQADTTDKDNVVQVYVYAAVRPTLPHYMRVIIMAGTCSIHMDSGIADLINTAPKNEQRYDDAKLIVGNKLVDNTMWGSVNPKGQGYTTIPVGDTSPLAKKDKSPVAVTGQKIESFMYVAPDRPEGMDDTQYADLCAARKEVLYGKKVLANYIHASVFSGKMRLFVQSQFCRKTYDESAPVADMQLEVINPPQFSTSKFNADGSVKYIYYPATNKQVRQYVNIANVAGGSTGIYTDDANNYWFISITAEGATSRVNVTKLRLSTCGAAVRRHLLKNEMERAEQAKFEALILSEAVADGDITFELPAVANVPNASPIAYGWSFNWKGDEASVVVHDRTQGVNFIGYLLKFKIKRDVLKTPTYASDAPAEEKLAFEKSRWSCAVTTVEGGSAWRNKSGLFNIWVPDYQAGGVYEYSQASDFNAVKTQGAAPIYCFYDVADNLKILRYTGSESEGNTETIGPPCYTYQDFTKCTINPGVTTGEINTHGYTYSGAFAIEGAKVTGRVVTTVTNKVELTVVNNGPTGNYANSPAQSSSVTGLTGNVCVSTGITGYVAALNTQNPPYTLTNYFVMYEVGTATQRIVDGIKTTSNLASVVIPWYDCSAVYLGESLYSRTIGNESNAPSLSPYKFREFSRVSAFDEFSNLIIKAVGPSFKWEYADQLSILGASVNSPIDQKDSSASYSFVGYGYTGSTQKGGWSDNLFKPSTFNLQDQQPFVTMSSAVYGDTVAPAVELNTGNYVTKNMNYKAFIGFA